MTRELLKCFLAGRVWKDTKENYLTFSDANLQGNPADPDKIWMFFDEGNHCGGRVVEIECSLNQIISYLDECNKEELKKSLLKDLQ